MKVGKAIKIQWSHSYSLDDGQNLWVVYKVLTQTLYCINEDRVGCGACEGEEALGDIVSSLSSLHLIKMISIDALWASMIYLTSVNKKS